MEPTASTSSSPLPLPPAIAVVESSFDRPPPLKTPNYLPETDETKMLSTTELHRSVVGTVKINKNANRKRKHDYEHGHM